MYGCSGHIECVTVWAMEVDSMPTAFAYSLDDRVSVSVCSIEKDIEVFCSVLCTYDGSFFLNVNPNYVWLTPDELSSGDFEIYSNVIWSIN